MIYARYPFISDETIYIGEEDDRGIAICPLKEKVQPRHAMLKAKPPQPPTKKVVILASLSHAKKDKKKSPNIALITASVTAAVLVTCITLASVGKYLLKNNRYFHICPTFGFGRLLLSICFHFVWCCVVLCCVVFCSKTSLKIEKTV